MRREPPKRSGQPSLQVWFSSWREPALNLAFEEYLFRSMPAGSVHLFGYRHRPCVVIGRNQNPWLECDLRYLRERDIGLYRRQSGGGTVYHDPGVLNFALLSSAARWSIQEFMERLRMVLVSHGVEAELTPRHGLAVAGRKISGSASWLTARVCLHHATLLFSANLEQLRRTLQPPALELTGHLVRSVPSPVVNLSELAPELTPEVFFTAAVAEIAAIGGYQAESATDPATMPGLAGDPRFRELKSARENAAWQFDRTPAFVHRITIPWPAADSELELSIEEGHVRHLRLTRPVPGLEPLLVEWNQRFCGLRYGPELVRAFAVAAPANPASYAFWQSAHTAVQEQVR